ncbi:MAG TPA: alkaline phosphatase family protein [Candidatus Limnocylindria bacterium]|nr:alkaline phosphatase family protein [Candidatus Limnocylindria bacterium]
MKLCLVASFVFVAAGLNLAALTNKVLIIGIDGTMPSAMAVASTPNINTLKSNGCYSTRVVTHPVTHSASCWSSMFTGVWGDKHAVNDPGNSFAGNQFATYPSFFKRIEAANSNLNTLAFARWAPMLTAVPDADVKLSFGSDAAVTDETCRRLTNSNPDVFWMLLLDVDGAGHSSGWGPTVTNYVRAIETADTRVGQIIGALANRVSYSNENWLVIVQTDHGEHDHPDLERSQVVFTIISGQAAGRGVMWPAPSIVDVCTTVLTHMGVPIDPAWKLDARVEGFPLGTTPYGTNLIFNGDAESNSGTNNYTPNRGVAWWFDLSSTTLGAYGGHTNFPSLANPGPTNRGSNFFLGGATNGYLLQRIDLSSIAADVADPGVDYVLSGWFGGAGSQGDLSALTARFLNSTSAVVGSNIIGNVSAADRTNITGLLARSTNGTLPSGTRFVEFMLTNRVVTGANDASADNLSFVLTRKSEPTFSVLAYGTVSNGWRVEFGTVTNRLYVLERSEFFDSWTEVTPVISGSGAVMSLTDTNTSSDQAFYRVARRRP